MKFIEKNIENIALFCALALFSIHVVNLIIEPSFDYFICLLLMVFWLFYIAIKFDSVDRGEV